MAHNMITGEIPHAAAHYLGSDIVLFSHGVATMTENRPVETFFVDCGQSSRLARARRYFIESYLRLHDFEHVHSDQEDHGVVFSMTANGQTYSLRVSEAWLVLSTHERVEERLDRLETYRRLHEHGTAYLDVTRTGQEVLSPSPY